MGFDFSDLAGKIHLILAATRIPTVPYRDCWRMAGRIQAPVKLLPGADHFYFGREKELSAGLTDSLSGFAACLKKSLCWM